MADSNPTVVVVSGTSGTSTQPTQQLLGPGYQQCLLVSTAALLAEVGFDSSSKICLESLAELLQSFIVELGRSSRAFTELACRTEPLGADVLLALTEMGYPSGYNLVRSIDLKRYHD
jgi:histone H3/H4